VTLVEPASFTTDWSGASATRTQPNPVYDGLKAAFHAQFAQTPIGKPEATAGAILKVVDDANPPLRILFGKVALPWAQQVYADRLATWEKWGPVSLEAHGA